MLIKVVVNVMVASPFLEPWHADVELFLEMRKNHGDEELKARDLFYALWIIDLLWNVLNLMINGH